MSRDGLIINGPPKSLTAIILAHGAGAGMDTDFMDAFAEGLGGHGLRVIRFEFPYMAERRQTGKRRPPDREPVLHQTWLDVIASIAAKSLFIGGKSMCGRIASLIADEAEVAGLVCLGYPFSRPRSPISFAWNRRTACPRSRLPTCNWPTISTRSWPGAAWTGSGGSTTPETPASPMTSPSAAWPGRCGRTIIGPSGFHGGAVMREWWDDPRT
jgi:hypothetical protein